MKIIDVSRPPKEIWLGRDGENNWRPIAFECASLLAKRPDGIITVWMEANGNKFPLPADMDGTKAVWYPQQEELFLGGSRIEVSLQSGENVGTSAIIECRVDESLIGNGEHPAQTAPPWTVQVVTDVTAQADRAEAAVASVDGKVETSVNEKLPEAVEDYFDEHPVVVEETDPTVPVWAKQPTKPTYTAREVGALPAGTQIPTKTSELQNDSGFVTEQQAAASAPLQSVNGKTGVVVLDASDVGALPESYTPPVSSVNGKTGVVVLDASDVGALPANTPIPAAVTEQTVAGWGFTKNTGTYSKPSGGIPKTDLASDVQASLGKADTALQQHQSLAGYATESYVQTQIAAIPDELPSDTASGAIASFPDGADDAPVKSLVAQIAPVQSGSGDPSPTNIRPISGWTSATVTRTGADNQSDTYTIAFPAEAGTVYGGTLDVTNGVLTVDSAIVDMGTLNWMYYPKQQRMVAQVNSAKPAAANVGLDGACSVYKVVNTGSRLMPDKSILIGNNFISSNYAAMVVHDSAYTDAETFKTAVSGQMLVFPIKKPIAYQLDPVTVTTLLGTNNIWADTGDVAVDYRADTGLYIQKLTGALQTKSITDTGGYYTTDTVDGALQEIGGKLLPSGGSTGDFLCKTASGVAWQTVPSAESNSFGGGA